MTRLEDRLERLEQRTEEIHRMLMHLIELQSQLFDHTCKLYSILHINTFHQSVRMFVTFDA